MPKLLINGQEIEVEDGTTVLQACEMAGSEIPRFCYHERLSIAGNCRMCLVEVEGMPKPIASCAMNVSDLRPGPEGQPPQINTNTPSVKKAREGVMEFLLINHPLDCPICDQGGECDLQDQAMAYGIDCSRYSENKRAVEDKNISPLIKTHMTRCIHCTRCVRFMTEIAGVEELGLISRGEDAEITTYLEKGMMSEMSGNVIDLCPVGALTSKPFAFTARPWELDKTESIDVMDAVGSNIRIDSRDGEVLRIMPRNHDDVNEEWLSDKGRFIWDGLRTQRLDQPYIRGEDGRLAPASWDQALELVASKMEGVPSQRAGALVGDLAAAEEIFALKQLTDRLEWVNIDCRIDGAQLDPKLGRASYLFNSTFNGFHQTDAILLIGANLQVEAPVLNAYMRGRWSTGALDIGYVGPHIEHNLPVSIVGHKMVDLQTLLDGQGLFADILRKANHPMIIMGPAALQGGHGRDHLIAGAKLAVQYDAITPGWNGFNVLHNAASRVAALDIGFVPQTGGLNANAIMNEARSGELDFLYLLGVDDVPMPPQNNCFVVYQGSHGDQGAHRADVILPGCTYTEKSGTYVNMEGRAQITARAVFPPGDAKEDWAILRAISARRNKPLSFNNLSQLRQHMINTESRLGLLNQVDEAVLEDITNLSQHQLRGLSNETIGHAINDYYMTNPIARASRVMAEMSALKYGLNEEERRHA